MQHFMVWIAKKFLPSYQLVGKFHFPEMIEQLIWIIFIKYFIVKCHIDITFSELKAFHNYSITLSICFPSAGCLSLKTAEFATAETCMLLE